jgi:serine/threonine-protein kinase
MNRNKKDKKGDKKEPPKRSVNSELSGFKNNKVTSILDKANSDYLVLVEQIAEGGISNVYKAKHIIENSSGAIMIEEEVAVKMIDLEGIPESWRQDAKDEFLFSIRQTSKLKHLNIISIQDFGEMDDGRAFCVMELLRGKDLLDSLKERGAFAWSDAKPIMLQVCKALQVGHDFTEDGKKKPIIHLNLNPGNIFLTQDHEGSDLVKLLDFGFAKNMSEESSTRKNQVYGTPGYMSCMNYSQANFLSPIIHESP